MNGIRRGSNAYLDTGIKVEFEDYFERFRDCTSGPLLDVGVGVGSLKGCDDGGEKRSGVWLPCEYSTRFRSAVEKSKERHQPLKMPTVGASA